MTIIQKEETIPERKVTRTTYVASDGKEFMFRSDCEVYEKRLAIDSHPVFSTSIAARTYPDDYSARLYNIRSKEDYDFFIAHVGIYSWSVNQWGDFGPGWYLCYSVDGGDYADYNYLYNYKAYKDMLLEEYAEWMRETDNIIGLPTAKVVVFHE